MIPAWSDGILACLDPGAGFFLIILTSATLSYTLGLVWNDQMLWADQNEKMLSKGLKLVPKLHCVAVFTLLAFISFSLNARSFNG